MTEVGGHPTPSLMSSPSSPTALLAPISNNDLPALISAIREYGSPSLQLLNDLLAHAIDHNAITTIPYLISLGASPLSDPPFSALYAPTAFPSFQHLILTGALDINLDLDPLGTFLILAVMGNKRSHVVWCLEHGADANQGTFASRWSPLAAAAEYEADVGMLESLIGGGAHVDGSDALHTAAEKGRGDMVGFLLGRGADVNGVGFEYCVSDSKSGEAGTALHFAVDGGSVGVARVLVEKGADVRIRDVRGRTAMERAREKGMDGVRLYLEELSREG
jgi:hypothetical protein